MPTTVAGLAAAMLVVMGPPADTEAELWSSAAELPAAAPVAVSDGPAPSKFGIGTYMPFDEGI